MLKKYLEWGVNILKKYKYIIKNLDCANCAREIEAKLNKDDKINNASVNFVRSLVIFETNYDGDVFSYVNSIIKSVEVDSYIVSEDNNYDNNKNRIIYLVVGTIIGLIGVFLPINRNIKIILLIIAYVILLYKTFMNALKLLVRSKTINENLLVFISCVGAFLIGEYDEGLMVIILYEFGKLLESMAVNKSRNSITELMNIKPEFANLKIKSDIKKVDPSIVKVHDVIVVKDGEKIPLDGMVIKGSARVNQAAITGESTLLTLEKGNNAISGMINEEGLIEIEVTSNYKDSTVNRILELVENASSKKAKTETFVSKAAKIYTPIIIVLSILIIVLGSIFTNIPMHDLLYRSLLFLVISCPCAIAISVPLSYFAGIGACSKKGILIKGSNYLDTLKNVNEIIFDKTGTITTGKFENLRIEILDKKYSEKYIKTIIVKGEQLSNHPIAKSMLSLININSNSDDVKEFKEYKGRGIEFKIDKDLIRIGNYNFCNNLDDNAILYVSLNDKCISKIFVTDNIKDNVDNLISYLKDNNINARMLTGDSKNKALEIAKKVGITDVSYELLPQDKYKIVEEEIKKNDKIIAFVGDGVNDAPTLRLSHVGISMGNIGSESAIEASDVVIVNDDISKIETAIKMSKFTGKIIKQNLIFAISIKILFLSLGLFGIATMWQAVFADVGVTVLTILNSIRILNK